MNYVNYHVGAVGVERFGRPCCAFLCYQTGLNDGGRDIGTEHGVLHLAAEEEEICLVSWHVCEGRKRNENRQTRL